jgi:hypothetical protein
MTSFTAKNNYSIKKIFNGPDYEVTEQIPQSVRTIYNRSSQTETDWFKPGDKVGFTEEPVFGENNLIFIGYYGNGIILRLSSDDQARNPYFFTNDDYQSGDTFQPNKNSFPVCFVKGTLITAFRGLVAIENLISGDLVQGSTGWRTVKWVGWRNYGSGSLLSTESKARIAPVRIHAHAIADNVPSSDLLTSPWHHLFVDGKLVRAGDLVNGATITQETHVNEVSYYHVELDQFDVIMAHGVYSESYADGGNRDFFQNVEVTSLRPEDMKRRRAPRPGFDHLVLRASKELTTIQDRINQRATSIFSATSKTQKTA